MARMLLTLIYISLLLASLPARSETTLAGVTLDDTFTLSDQALVLNGAGVRSKFLVDVYVGALYLPRRSRTAHEVLTTQPGP